ncbi:MAG: GTP 3',8-cyclase MoaA [Pseudochelatococcus sp.]|jgi:cyclic pyranopterin phosphate synthase|uniref:GTP 3',8-cyclase MoaA n=1 Tax=Pseudochelatococcus sp. TaxID=2020869 RepID=UPI003D8DBAB4
MNFQPPALLDGHRRRFHYLRLSITEVCNFRCTYCLPNGWRKADGAAPASYLAVDEITRLVRAFAGLGISKIRLTGGEPAVRKDLAAIIAAVAATPGIGKVALTTNGWNLRHKLPEWRAAGLTNLNVSIDSLDAGDFHAITGHDRLADVLAGVDLAIGMGLPSVKVNAVLLRETAAKGFDDWARFVRHRPVAVRFIELMRTGDNGDYFAAHHTGGMVLCEWLEAHGWSRAERRFDDGPAVEYTRPDHAGRIGLIAPYAPGFCDTCNRLRVTARGKLRLCLFGDGGLDLRDLLQDDADMPELGARVKRALSGKAATHFLHENDPGATRNLAQVGG